ncbi:TPA: hypothetical protein NO871_003054 [Klebsiella quasipneumoniae subsp. quasipneumoniae]|nr:hypothetical protein [Klebsiella quasipneumoniae subsp. quasipneumoniae]
MCFIIGMELAGGDMRQHQGARAEAAIFQAGVEQGGDGQVEGRVLSQPLRNSWLAASSAPAALSEQT